MKKIAICFLTLLLFLFIGCEKETKNASSTLTTKNKVTSTSKINKYDVTLPVAYPIYDEDSVQIHYNREDNKYSLWTLWLWDPEGTDDSLEDDFNYMDDFGVIAYYKLSKFGELSSNKLGIIIKKKGSWTKDATESDRFIDFSKLEKDENGIYHVYFFSNDENVYTNKDKVIVDSIESAKFTSTSSIRIEATSAIEKYELYANDELIASGSGAGRKIITVSVPKDHTISFSNDYVCKINFRQSNNTLESNVSFDGLYNSDLFNNLYYYDGELGAIYSKEETEFKVWSPAANSIRLRIYDNGTPLSVSKTLGDDTYTEYEMIKGDKAVYSYTIAGDLSGKYYTYVVYSNKYLNGKEIVDPYAKSTGINGLRGMVVDFSSTNPDGWDDVDYLTYDRKSLTVYELHVADLTSSDTWNGSTKNKRKYTGLIEEGTTYTSGGVTVKTGFDHIKDLGVNAVQILPIFDSANDETEYTFNWGYNPLNYNSLDGMYSINPYDGYEKIKEFKEVVKTYAENGIMIIMDVVYNHVNGANASNFDVLMPGYYFRYNADGSLSNGSGCGNETASENKMMRKFIVDSVTFWLKEYKLSGFRFDLMGLHDIDTMNEIAEKCNEINPNVVIYGEPWTGGTSTLSESLQAKQSNANKFVGYGQFNDQMRDALIKGGLSSKEETGWITNESKVQAADVLKIEKGIAGITYNGAYSIDDPNKTVNYVTCHDNYTIYDRIVAAGITDSDTIVKMALLSESIVFTSNGTTFMQAGEEFLRTKQGNSNSYNATDEINALDYSLLIKNSEYYESFKKIISFKQNTKALCTDDTNIEVEARDAGATLIYELKEETKTYLVIHSNGVSPKSAVDTTGYSVYYDSENRLSGKVDSVTPNKFETIILVKDN